MKGYLVAILLILPFDGLFSQTKRIDNSGNLEVLGRNGEILEYQLLDKSNHLREGKEMARIVYQYDSSGQLTLESYYRSSGRPYQTNDGVAAKRYTRGRSKDFLIVEHLDSMGRRVNDLSIGASIVYYKYNDFRQVESVVYFDVDSTVANNSENYARTEIRYFPQKEERRFDADGKLVKVRTERTLYVSGLRIDHRSVPSWFLKGFKISIAEDVKSDSLKCQLTLVNQKSNGRLSLTFKLQNGHVDDVCVVESEAIAKKSEAKIVQILRKAYFISLSNQPASLVDGKMVVNFMKGSCELKE
jgi:hypothetical protein